MTSATESESFEASIVLCGAAGVMTMHGKARGEGTTEAVPNLEACDSRLEQTHAISLYLGTAIITLLGTVLLHFLLCFFSSCD